MNNNIAAVKLREIGKTENFLASSNLKLVTGDCVIVERERGSEYGIVASEPVALLEAAEGQPQAAQPLFRVIRKATPGDLHQIERNKNKIKELTDTCDKKIQEHNLSMKLIDAEYSFDRSKITFYFTSDARVDFRNLVKDLAAIFKARIELKQIGVRDEAKLLGGFGPCGHGLCCAKFLKDFKPVTIKMAKEQNLSLNPTKISGLCGRLMCCLSYEYDVYKELMAGMPHPGDKIKMKDVSGTVVSINAIKRTVVLHLEDGRQIEMEYKEKSKEKKAKE
ncbi:MAG: stage 0 sporulation family protein [Candidatus Omnitrophica bacterium]|nr:stage 0 sporulation family protein [Candidatus Omnitrophota bacterium]